MKILFPLLAVVCACFVCILMLYPPMSSLLSRKTDMIVKTLFNRTVTQAQVSVKRTCANIAQD